MNIVNKYKDNCNCLFSIYFTPFVDKHGNIKERTIRGINTNGKNIPDAINKSLILAAERNIHIDEKENIATIEIYLKH